MDYYLCAGISPKDWLTLIGHYEGPPNIVGRIPRIVDDVVVMVDVASCVHNMPSL